MKFAAPLFSTNFVRTKEDTYTDIVVEMYAYFPEEADDEKAAAVTAWLHECIAQYRHETCMKQLHGEIVGFAKKSVLADTT
jgi:hypothetical protein